MKIVVVGLPEREAFAVSLLMSKLRPDWEFQSQPADVDSVPADLYVLDADAWQERHGTQSGTAKLQALVKQKPAVLLTAPVAPRPEAQAQADAAARDWGDCGWVVLRRPFRAAAMGEALRRAEQRVGGLAEAPADVAKPAEQAHDTPEAPGAAPNSLAAADRGQRPGVQDSGGVTRFSSAFFTTTVQSALDGAPAPSNAGLPPPDITDDELTLEAFAACVPTAPSAECRRFLGALAERLAQPGVFEMSFTLMNGIVFDRATNWVASNTPMSVVRMVARSRSLGTYVKTTDLDARVEPRARARQRGMQEHRLGALLHAFARMAECRLPAP